MATTVVTNVAVLLLLLQCQHQVQPFPQGPYHNSGNGGSICSDAVSAKECSCTTQPDAMSEIFCPPMNPGIEVRIKHDLYTLIQCNIRQGSDFSLLPQLAIGTMKQLKIVNCPLPRRQSIREFVAFLGMEGTGELWLQNNEQEPGATGLVREHLRGMGDLKRLSISQTAIDGIQPDLFADLPNLQWLYLRENRMQLPDTIFNNLTKLTVLELSSNNMARIEPALLRNLTNLTHLNLFRNNLQNVTRQTFAGTPNLKLLDLSINSIETLPGDVFADLPALDTLNLGFNSFASLPKGLLDSNRKMEKFILNRNNGGKLTTLPPALFRDMPMLTTINMQLCGLETLPSDTFHGSPKITYINLFENRLTTLPDELLRDQRELKELNLASNQLLALPDTLLGNAVPLRILRLSYNKLTELTALVFQNLENLEELYLGNNMLQTIHRDAFSSTKALLTLHLQNNRLSFLNVDLAIPEIPGYRYASNELSNTDGTAFQYLHKLNELYLANNSVSTILRDWNLNNYNLATLDLSFNNLTSLSYANLQFLSPSITVNLTHNKIAEIQLYEMQDRVLQQPSPFKAHILLNDNPLNCNCITLSFVQYLQRRLDQRLYDQVTLTADSLTCQSPPNLRNTPISAVDPLDLLCALDVPTTQVKRCPDGCSCNVRPVDGAVLVNCSDLGLTELPEALPQPSSFGYKFTVLYLENNNISALPHRNRSGYDQVRELHIRNNSLTNLVADRLPVELRMLDVSANLLTGLNVSVLDVLNGTAQLRMNLSDNQWECRCESSDFLLFAQTNFRRIPDYGRLMCDDGRQISNTTISELCSADTTVLVVTCLVLTAVAILFGLAFFLLYAYQMEIKVWLFAHNLCLWFVSEEDLDKDKRYDGFVSYSHKDDEFVSEHLVPALEKEPMNFKICLHERDWTPGELISEQIAKSVEDSRRTIVVLSSNFLESVWGRMEFRAAYFQSLEERRTRVIVIILGDIGNSDDLDPELRAYLKTNTYVKWGDPWFWEKLRYAMPHPPTVRGLKGTKLIKSHLKSSVDDKLELIKPVPVTPPPLTTPPAEINGGLLNGSPFTITGSKTVPNGSSGHLLMNGHINGAFTINTNAKQSDV